MRVARILIALPLLALSLAFAGDKERNANGPDKRADPFVKEGVCECEPIWTWANGRRDCPACGKRFDANTMLQICPSCSALRGVCGRCLKRLPDKKQGADEARCRCGMRTEEFRRGGRCGACKAEIDQRDKLCGKCAKAAGVCAWCGIKKTEGDEPRQAVEPDRDPLIKEGICPGCCGPDLNEMPPKHKCAACDAMIIECTLCGDCATKRGICPICLKRRPEKKAGNPPAAAACGGCARPNIGPAEHPCPACKKPRMARFQKACDPCADAKGICSICGKPKPPREKRAGAQTRKEREFQTVPGEYLGISRSRRCVIREMKDWEALWNEFISHKTPVPPVPDLPKVGFEKEMLIAVFRGDCSNNGYGIEIKRMEESDLEIIVHVDEINPEEGSMHGDVETQPHHIVKTAKSDKPVRFERLRR